MIACLEEIAYRQGWITADSLVKMGEQLKNNGYGRYLMKLVSGG